MIKVANIHVDARHLAGPQQRAIQVGEGLLDRGVRTWVVVSSVESEEMVERLRNSPLDWSSVPMYRLTRDRRYFFRWLLRLPYETWLLYRELKRITPDIVHVNGVWQVKGVIAARLAGAKVALHLNDTVVYTTLKMLIRLLAPLSDGFIFAAERSRKAYRWVERFAGRPKKVVPAPVNVVRYDPAKTKPSEMIAYAGTGPKVLTVAHISYVKGGVEFVSMAKKVLEVHPDATFHIVGKLMESQQTYIDRVKAMVAELPEGAVTIHGPSDEVPSVMKAADVFVCSSISEASPMSVWEAMSMEMPVVSTDVGDVSRHIRDGENGFIVDVGDVDGLADRVLNLIEDRDKAASFGQAARREVLETLSLDACVERHAAFYRELLET